MNRLKELRESHGMKQSELGKLLNVKDSAISKYEAEKVSLTADTVIRLSEIFKVSTDYLLGLTNSKTEMPDLSKNLGFMPNRLEKLLNELDDGFEFCSYAAKIEKSNLQQYLQGTLLPSSYEICKIIEVLDTSADYLFGISDIMHPTNNHAFISADKFPRIFNEEVERQSYLKIELSDKLNVSISKIERLLSGEEIPESNILFKLAQLLEKSTDYLLGLVKQSRSSDSSGVFPFKTNLNSIERIQNLLGSDTDDYIASKLNLTDDELFNLYHYGFIPHINVINKLCDMFSVSADYLLGLSDSKLSIVLTNDVNEDYLLKSYRQLDISYQKKIDGVLAEQLLQQERDSYMRSSVAADEPLKKTGTENMGK